MKNLVILGSTGSIGTQALRIVDKYPDRFRVVGLSCHSNHRLLSEQIAKYSPKYVFIDKNSDKLELKGAKLVRSMEELVSVNECDTVLTAVVGTVGIKPTWTAVQCDKDIALANKETLVACGELIMRTAREKGVNIYPVDSEHSAIWQCLNYGAAKNVKKLILTASGGAFRGKTVEELKSVTVKDALKHPTWNMGVKVTIDSASLMNKGLEIIEAMHLFGMPSDRIDVLVHKESVVHSMVQFDDNSVVAELSRPSMILPIQLALTYPEKIESEVEELDLASLAALSFERADEKTFRCLAIAKECAARGGLYTAVMNAANEIAVEAFISNKIGFLDIPYYIEEALSKVNSAEYSTIEEVLEADAKTRESVARRVSERV